MTDDAHDADELERAEAQALAAALDAQPSERVPPEDALQTALLMRYGGANAELSSARSDAILAQLSAELPRLTQRRARVLRSWAWGGLAAAAAIGLAVTSVLWTSTTSAPQSAAPAPASVQAPVASAAGSPAPTLPQPSVQLLSAQTALLRGEDPQANARFERELSAYRAELFRTLQAAYPEKLGSLEAGLREPRYAAQRGSFEPERAPWRAR